MVLVSALLVIGAMAGLLAFTSPHQEPSSSLSVGTPGATFTVPDLSTSVTEPEAVPPSTAPTSPSAPRTKRVIPPRLPSPPHPSVPTLPAPTASVPSPREIVESIPSTTAVRPAFEPFVVTGRHGYWIAEPDEPTARWLMPLVNSGDSWSPDGTRIVHRSTPSTISITDVRTGERRTLVDGSGSRSDPRWSPDGRHVAIHEGRSERGSLLIVDLSGNEVARYDDWVDGQNGFAWSPDGERIAYASLEPTSGAAWLSIATLGGEVERIATGDVDSRFLGLVWSPRGTHLGWTFDQKLHLLQLADRSRRTLDVGGMPVYGHAWSPDEALIYPWGPSLYRLRPDGAEPKLLDSAGHAVTVEPGTGRLAWASGYGLGRTTAIVSAPGGTEPRVVLRTTPDAAIDGVIWSPAGRQFLFIQYGGV